MAAMLKPDMRAVSINISADSGAGGFILPNDHVDVILARKLDGNPPRVIAKTILTDVRVLAVDQTFKQDKDTKTVIGKTATLEADAGPGAKHGRGREYGHHLAVAASLGGQRHAGRQQPAGR